MAKFQQTITVDCPHCASPKVIKKGARNGYQRYQCKECERKFSANGKPFRRWNHAEHIGAAIDMYYSGMSYKQIAELLKRNFDLPEPSKATIYRWVKEYSDAASGVLRAQTPQTSGHWVADEMQLKVGGERFWNWNVMDRDTRYVLAVHLSKHRGAGDAERVMAKALRANGGAAPKTITTDGLGSYGAAISLMFPHTKHIVSEGIHKPVNNNLSERLQGTFRDRTKTLRGLQGRRSGQDYLDGWSVDYNLFRDHHALDGDTPGEAAKIDLRLDEWTDVVKAVGEYKAAVAAAGADRKAQKKAEAKSVGYQAAKPAKAAAGKQGRGGQQLRMVGPRK